MSWADGTPDVDASRMSGRNAPRRVVTGHTPDGASVVVFDGPVPVSCEIPEDGVSFHEIWNTEGAPARITAVETTDPTLRPVAVPPPARGTKIRVNEFAPGQLNEHGLQSPMHRTASIDYGIVLAGEITLILDTTEVTPATSSSSAAPTTPGRTAAISPPRSSSYSSTTSSTRNSRPPCRAAFPDWWSTASAPLAPPSRERRYWAGTPRRRAASWLGGAPNRRRYSRLNCDGLS